MSFWGKEEPLCWETGSCANIKNQGLSHTANATSTWRFRASISIDVIVPTEAVAAHFVVEGFTRETQGFKGGFDVSTLGGKFSLDLALFKEIHPLGQRTGAGSGRGGGFDQ